MAFNDRLIKARDRAPRSLLLRPYSLRTAMVLITLVCLALAFLGNRAHLARKQTAAVRAILDSGGVVVSGAGSVRRSSLDANDLNWSLEPDDLFDVTTVVLSSRTLPSLEAFPNLQSLRVTDDVGDDECSQHIAPLTNLCSLTLRGPQLTGRSLSQLLRSPLRELILTNVDLQALSLDAAPELALEIVSLLDCTHVSADAVSCLVGPRLSHFALTGAPLTDAELCCLPLPAELALLDLSACDQLTNVSVDWITVRCPRLQVARLSSPLIDEQSLPAFSRLAACSQLDLRGTGIPRDGFVALAQRLGANCRLITSFGEYYRGQLTND